MLNFISNNTYVKISRNFYKNIAPYIKIHAKDIKLMLQYLTLHDTNFIICYL